MARVARFSEVLDILKILDSLSSLFNSIIVEQKLMSISILSSRYYIALHDILLPVGIKDAVNTIPKVVLIPNTTIYIHEQNVYATFRMKQVYDNIGLNSASYIPIIDLSTNENLLILASSALAHRIALTPNEKNILRIMPNNIRTYVEAALRVLENSINTKMKSLPLTSEHNTNVIEFILWVDEAKNSDVVEVRYLKGITMRILRIVYQDYEVDIKTLYAFPPKFIARLISILPNTILTSILDNIEGAYRIMLTYRSLCT